MRILLVSIYSFPNGYATTNRIVAYSKGLVNCGNEVQILMTYPTDQHTGGPKTPDSGIFQGIKYKYTNGRYRSPIKLMRGIAILTKYRVWMGNLRAVLEIIRIQKIQQYDFMLLSTDAIFALYCFSRLSNIMGMKSVFVFDEYPIPIRHFLKEQIPQWKEELYKFVLNKIDAYISISHKLAEYYCGFARKKYHVLPVIVDTDRFDKIKQTKQKSVEYLCYMGNMELTKDNVDLIIKAFYQIKDHENLQLHLYGSPDQLTLTKLQKLIKSFKMEDVVIIKGSVPSTEVPQILADAKILVSSQPNTLRASGGFPTKLGEYILSGVPTLVTDVGENSLYVKDGEHCFFVCPDNIDQYIAKLLYILDNYDMALDVAKNGMLFVRENYSYVEQGHRLNEFLESL